MLRVELRADLETAHHGPSSSVIANASCPGIVRSGKSYDARMAAKGTLERTRGALRSPDFRRLLSIRLASQSADGSSRRRWSPRSCSRPEEQSTTAGFAQATLIVALPFSMIGPFTGVFIDRWSRRRIMRSRR